MVFILVIKKDLKPTSRLKKPYDKLITDIHNESLRHGAHLERLHGSRYLSLRVTLEDRLLLIPLYVFGQKVWYVVEIVEHHRYHKSQAKSQQKNKEARLRAMLLKDRAHIEACVREAIHNAGEESKESEESAFENIHALDPQNALEAIMHDGHCFVLSDAQQEAKVIQLPNVITGPPGSGKTVVGTEILLDFAQRYYENASEKKRQKLESRHLKPALYLTKSARLVDKVQKDAHHNSVCNFLTYNHLLEKLGECEGKELVDDEHLIAYLERCQSQVKLHPQADVIDNLLKDKARLIQEFRTLSRIPLGAGIEQYEALGQRNSLYSDQTEREWIFKAYQGYLQHLNDKKALHPAFHHIKSTHHFELGVIDESQDLSPLQLANLKKLCGKNILYLTDLNQALQDGAIPDGPYLRQLTGIKRPYVLEKAYRCPAIVCKGANNILALKSRLLGNIDKDMMNHIDSRYGGPGEFKWYDNKDDLKRHPELFDNPNLIILIAHEHYRAEAEALFDTSLVCTIEEAKGLQEENILLYCPLELDEQSVKTIVHKLHSDKAQHTQYLRKHKTVASDEEKISRFFNALYTAYTRAMKQLIIYQPEKKHPAYKTLTAQLKEGIALSDETEKKPAPTPVISTEQKAQAWLKNAKRFEALGHSQQATKARLKAQALNKEPMDSQSNAPNETPNRLKLEAESKEAKKATPEATSKEESANLKIKKSRRRRRRPKTHQELAPKSTANPDKEMVKALEVELNIAFMSNDFSSFLKKYDLATLLENPSQRAAFLTNVTCFGQNPALQPHYHTLINELFRFLTSQDKLPSLLGKQLIYFSTIPQVLSSLYQHNPGMVTHWIVQTWHIELKEISDDIRYRSIIEVFFCTPHGNALFAKLLEDKPEVAKQLPKSLFARVLKEETDAPIPFSSPLYWLSCSRVGQILFARLLELNPDLALEVDSTNLEQPLKSPKSERFQFTSALYWLCVSDKNHTILNSLLNKNPKIIQEITAEGLQRPLTHEKAGKYQFASPLLGLCASSSGQKILFRLINENPVIAQGLQATALERALTNPKADSLLGASPLYYLCKTKESRAILFTLIQKNPNLAQEITAASLERTLSDKNANELCNTSPLYWLCTLDGVALLFTLLQKNPMLAKGFTGQGLSRTNNDKTLNTNPHHSPLSLLLGTHLGIVVIEAYLLKYNPNLGKHIDGATLANALNNEREPNLPAECTTFALLCQKEAHQNVLAYLLLNNKSFVKHLSFKSLKRHYNNHAEPSPLYRLCTEEKGLMCLKLIIDKNPNAKMKLNEILYEQWNTYLSDEEHQEVKVHLEKSKLHLEILKPAKMGFFHPKTRGGETKAKKQEETLGHDSWR